MLETFLDVFLVEELPVENAEATGVVGLDGKEIVTTQRAATKPFLGVIKSCGDKFPMSGQWVDNPYSVGDTVHTNEFGRDYLTLDPFREFAPINRTDKQYYLIRYEDIRGRVSA